MGLWLAVMVVLGGMTLPPLTFAQCCAESCFDADGDGTDDRVSCRGPGAVLGPTHDEPVIVAGCLDAAPAGCIGGRTRAIGPFVEEGRLPTVGCVCAGGSCVAGDPETGELLMDATAEECALGAAYFCHDAGNAQVISGGCG